MDELGRRIINSLQGGFPLCDEPYKAVAEQLGIGEAELITRIESMLHDKVLTRFGPMFQVERVGGAFVLAALAVPEERFEEVAAQVNGFPEVAHNYRREHRLNMWFVVAAETREAAFAALARIEAATGLRRSRSCAASAASSCPCRCRTRRTRSRPTTSWRRPRRRATWRAMTACATA